MIPDSFDTAPVMIRADLRAALNRAHECQSEAGDWLDGTQRLAVMAEARQAWDCEFCQSCKDALSPYAVTGSHVHLGTLPHAWIDVIHRVVTDSGRLSARWYAQALTDGMVEDEVIEVISIAVQAVVVDCFTAGIGMETPAALPAKAGEASRQHRADAKTGPGWAATIAPEDADDDFVDFYDNESHFYIRRSLTLVPGETRRLWDLLNNLYMEDPRLYELEGMERQISRAQMEFLAARASALLGCYY
jgi:hypothetical protein